MKAALLCILNLIYYVHTKNLIMLKNKLQAAVLMYNLC